MGAKMNEPHHLVVRAAPGVRRRQVAANPWPAIFSLAVLAFVVFCWMVGHG